MSHGLLLVFRTLVTVLLFLTFSGTFRSAWISAVPGEVFSTERRTETHSQDDVLTSTPAITHSVHSGRLPVSH